LRTSVAASPLAEVVAQVVGGRAARLGIGAQRLEERTIAVAAGKAGEAGVGDAAELDREIAEAAAAEAGAEPEAGHVAAQGLALVVRGLGGERPRGGARRRLFEQPPPERGQAAGHRHRAGVGAAHLDVALEADLGEQRREVDLPVAQRGALAAPPFGHEAAEGEAVGGAVGAVAHEEEHRHVGRPLGVVAEREPRLEREARQAAAVLVGLEPDRGAVALPFARASFDDGGRGVEGRDDRRHAVGGPDLVDGVRFAVVVEVGLHRGGHLHHVVRQPARAPVPREVVAHHRVTPLGEPVDVAERAERPVADAEQPHALGVGELAHLAHVRGERVATGGRGRQSSARQLELAARLERDAIARARKGDDLPVLLGGAEPARAQPAEDVDDATRPPVGDGRA